MPHLDASSTSTMSIHRSQSHNIKTYLVCCPISSHILSGRQHHGAGASWDLHHAWGQNTMYALAHHSPRSCGAHNFLDVASLWWHCGYHLLSLAWWSLSWCIYLLTNDEALLILGSLGPGRWNKRMQVRHGHSFSVYVWCMLGPFGIMAIGPIFVRIGFS